MEALSCGCSSYSLFVNLGIICAKTSRSEEAIAHYSSAIEKDPVNPEAFHNLGHLYQGLGNLDQALVCLSKHLKRYCSSIPPPR